MSDAASFTKFVPGFDFLQNLSKGSGNSMPGMNSWVAPTLDPEELEKRITDLKAVLFWLDQNATALKATIQALEVQKMTLTALKGMNMDMSAMAKAFAFPGFGAPSKAADAAPASVQPSVTEPPQPTAPKAESAPPPKPRRQPAAAKSAATATHQAAPAKPSAMQLDPLQLWGSLTQQFQQIATNALQEVTQQAKAMPMGGARAANPSTAHAAPEKGAKKPAAKKARTPKS